MITVTQEFLEEVLEALEGHRQSAYCQAFDNDDELIVAQLKAMLFNTPLTETQIEEVLKKQKEKTDRKQQEALANEKHKCPQCQKSYVGVEGKKQLQDHIAGKHKILKEVSDG